MKNHLKTIGVILGIACIIFCGILLLPYDGVILKGACILIPSIIIYNSIYQKIKGI